MSAGSEPTEFNRNLTTERGRLRNLHHQRSWKRPTSQDYRSHQLIADNPNTRHLKSYDLKTQDGETLGSVELDHFQNADDLVRFIDLAIHQSFEDAVEWARAEFEWGWSQ